MPEDRFIRTSELKFSGKTEATEQTAKTDSKPSVYRFGTSGWRAIDEFTEEAVQQITNAFADFLVKEAEHTGQALPVLIGGDTRDKTRMAIPIITRIMTERGFDVYQAKSDVPTPVLAYATKHFNKINPQLPGAQGGFLITASHNPWEYGGYNFLTAKGAIIPDALSKQIEALQSQPANRRLASDKKPEVKTFEPYEIYKDHLINGLKIDFDAIRKSGLSIHYDPLFATGRNYLPRILKEAGGVDVHAIHNTEKRPPGYKGMPEPTGKQLKELSENVRKDSAPLKIGLANDGDADRYGVIDEKGRYVNPNEVLLLITHHLIKNKQQKGVIVRNIATTTMLDALARRHGLPVVETPVGYKYIAEEFERHGAVNNGPQVLIGGESSGGLSVLGHLPEKDGILANLLIAELVATERRPLSEILQNLKSLLAEQYAFREGVIKTPYNQEITQAFQELQRSGVKIGGLKIDRAKSEGNSLALEKAYQTRDGAKLWFTDGSWLVMRPSGTEPALRLYLETVGDSRSEAEEKSLKLMNDVRNLLETQFAVKPKDIQEKPV